MIETITYVISAVFITLSIMHIYNKINNSLKFNTKNVFYFTLSVVIFAVSYAYAPPFLRQMVILILLFLMSFIIFKNTIKLSLINAIYLEIVCIISEAIYGIIYLLVNQNVNLVEWNHSVIGTIFSNIVIPLIMIGISNLKINKKVYKLISNSTVYLSKQHIAIVVVFFFLIVNILFYAAYFLYYLNKKVLFITIILLFLLYTFVLIVILNTSNKYENIKGKYSLSLENLSEYEEMLNQYRISNHENKNQLLLIRNMVKDKKTREYIDELIDNKEKDDSSIYNIVQRIPIDSIRAVIYSKLLLMRNKNISFDINMDRKIHSKDFANMSSNLVLDVCNILNVFIDNAIDEVSSYKKKQVLIEFSKINDEIEIAISNICDKDIDLTGIYGMGYSTKGGNHGYGLSIVKNTINNNSNILRNETEKINNVFTQYLYIKIK
ncbi:MAG: GHKL domain-containing protein [Bacilli bacterium]|nr:GHKL domain-containing protein [Bacilli bacterium]